MEQKRILIVEDEALVAEDLKMIVTSHGYKVIGHAMSGDDAVAKAFELNPDLILMDIVLKGMKNGIIASQEIREKADIPIVFISAYSDTEVLEKAKIVEPYGYIVKPFQERQLHATIRMALFKDMMEKKLKERELWLHTTLKSIADAVIATDLNKNILFINPVAVSLIGCPENSVGKEISRIFELFDDETLKPVGNVAEEVMKKRTKIIYSDVILNSNRAAKIPVDCSASPIKDEQNRMMGVVIVFRDISERKKLEMELKKFAGDLELAKITYEKIATQLTKKMEEMGMK